MRINSRILLPFAFSVFIETFVGTALRSQTPAFEGTPSGGTEITLFAGISAPVNHESKGFGLDVKAGTPIDGRVSYNFNRHNTVELSVANPFSVSANYVYNFSAFREKWAPYVTAGVGGTRQEIALSDNNQPAQLNSNLMETGPDRSQTVFTENFGGGLKYFFTERFALRLDEGSKTLNDLQITSGIVFRSGSKR
jgi:hypothetical protein